MLVTAEPSTYNNVVHRLAPFPASCVLTVAMWIAFPVFIATESAV